MGEIAFVRKAVRLFKIGYDAKRIQKKNGENGNVYVCINFNDYYEAINEVRLYNQEGVCCKNKRE